MTRRHGVATAEPAHHPSATQTGLLDDLSGLLPADAVVTDPDVVASYSRDQTRWIEPGRAVAVVLPRSTEEVVAVVRAAARAGVAVVPRGAGSGLSGGATATDGCIVLCLTRMDAIVSIDVAEQLAVVQPGVVTADLGRAVASRGLWYAPDPSSWEWSTIGGNVATNAGGLCCVKYGVTADAVRGLEVVLADGTRVRTGRRTVKGVAGYDLTRLFVGSEGTLGVITEVTVGLRPQRPPAATVAAFFPTLAAAGAAVVDIVGSPVRPALLELMDRTTLRAVDDWTRMDLDRSAAALLLAQSDAGGSAGEEEIRLLEQLCSAAGASDVITTVDADEGESVLAARRAALPALERLGSVLLDDVAVPRTQIPALLAAVEVVAADSGLTIGTFGHAGDGNLHPTIVFDDGDAASRARAQNAFGLVVQRALDLGGTITGEHGVGLLKRDWLERELGSEGLLLHRTVKTALDPLGTLNPGKLLNPW